jgi:hypothetical protein
MSRREVLLSFSRSVRTCVYKKITAICRAVKVKEVARGTSVTGEDPADVA